jgi:hypothetical protein
MEATIYTTPFLQNLDIAANPQGKQIPTTKKQQEKTSMGKQIIEASTVPDDIDIIWHQTFKSYIALNFKDPLIKRKRDSFTNRITRKTQQRENDRAVTQNILKSSVDPQLQEMMAISNAKKDEPRCNGPDPLSTFLRDGVLNFHFS